MKSYLVLATLILILVTVHFHSAASLGQRPRERNNFQRKLKSCNFLCVFSRIHRRTGTQYCYKLDDQNMTVSECVALCLQIKGENLDSATRCECVNGVCKDDTTTTSATTVSTTATSDTTTPITTAATTTVTQETTATQGTTAVTQRTTVVTPATSATT